MSPAKFRWGLIFIQIGIILILYNTGVIDFYWWVALLGFFPFFLIAVGIEKIFTKSPLRIISYLTSVALFFGGLAIVYVKSYGSNNDSFFSETRQIIEYDDTIKRVEAIFNLGNTDLKIRDAGNDLFYGRFDEFTMKPEIITVTNGSTKIIELNQRKNSFLGGIIKIDIDEPTEWYIKLNDKIPFDIKCIGFNSEIYLNLETIFVERLTLDANESEITIKLGDLYPNTNVKIDGAGSKLKLRIPSSTGTRILSQDLGDYLTRINLIETDDGFYINEGYDTMITKINIELDNQIDDLNLIFY